MPSTRSGSPSMMTKRMSREKVHGSGCKEVSADGGWICKPGWPSESLGRPQNDEIQICDQGPGICISLKTHPRQSALTASHGPINVPGGPLLRLLLWFQWLLLDGLAHRRCCFPWISSVRALCLLRWSSVLCSWDKFWSQCRITVSAALVFQV